MSKPSLREARYLADTRKSYDTVATAYDEHFHGVLSGKPWARAFLGVFAQLVHAAGSGPVLDIGCGTGLVTGHLSSIGLDVRGVDLSPGMLDEARARHPGLRFDQGTMTDLRVPPGQFTGVVAWYSVIHVPPTVRPGVFAGFRRALEPGGYLLLAFQVRDEVWHRDEALGHRVSLDYQPATLDGIAAQLERAGLRVEARFVRESDDEESTPHAHLIARKPL